MISRLAIVTAQVGAATETFIRRHIEDLLPGRTAVVARHSVPTVEAVWKVSCPLLSLDRWALQLPVRLARSVGQSEARLRDVTVRRFLRRNHVSVVLGEYLDQFVDFVPLLERMNLRYVVQGHGLDLSASLRTPGMAERYRIYKSAAAVLTRCESHRQRLIAIGLPAESIYVNPGGVDIPPKPQLRAPAARKRFLAVGRMVPKKGPIYLLEAFRRAAAHDPEITMDYIGGGQLFAAARQFVDASGLQDRIRLHGPVPEKIKSSLFEDCGVFVQHSVIDPESGDEEGLPAAIQEAMAHAMAVISTRHAGIADAIEHGVDGLLVEERDVSAMSEAMCFVAGEVTACARLGSAAHLKAAQFYSWPAECARILTALEGIH